MKKERWKPVVGMEAFYDVSTWGRIRSKHTIGRPAECGLLSQQYNKKGYRRVRLSACGKSYTIVVHRLVLDAFIGSQPSAIHQSNHKNGVKDDNYVENLEWVTPVENNAHAVRMGLWKPHKGEAHGRAKLTAKDIPVIRVCEGKETSGQVAKRYGVTSTAIRLIWRRVNWKHIK